MKIPGTRVSIGRDGAEIGGGLKVFHYNGNLWKMCSLDGWETLKTGESRVWDMNGSRFINQDSTLFPRWFFACEQRCDSGVQAADCCNPAVIKSTEKITYNKPDFVAPFDKRETYLRSKKDKFEPKSPEELYEDNESKSSRQYGWPIIPQPTVRLSETSVLIRKISGQPIKSGQCKTYRRSS